MNENDFLELQIKVADYVISLMNNVGSYDISSMIAKVPIKSIMPNISENDEAIFDLTYRSGAWSFLVDNGYVDRLENYIGQNPNLILFRLSDDGKKIKKRNGHRAYLKYEETMDKLPFKKLNWAKIAAIAALLTLILSLVEFFRGCNNNQHAASHLDTTITIKPIVNAKFAISK